MDPEEAKKSFNVALSAASGQRCDDHGFTNTDDGISKATLAHFGLKTAMHYVTKLPAVYTV